MNNNMAKVPNLRVVEVPASFVASELLVKMIFQNSSRRLKRPRACGDILWVSRRNAE